MCWRPDDYVLYGRYCETENLRTELNALRATSDARAAVFIAYRGKTLFHSLLLVAHEADKHASRLQSLALARPQWPPHALLPFARSGPNGEDDRWLLDQLKLRPPFSRLGELLGTGTVILRRDGDGKDEDGVVPPASINVLLAHASRPDAAQVKSQLDHLFVMANASAPVVVNGSLELERRADAALDRVTAGEMWDTPYGNPMPHDDQAQRTLSHELLDQALKLTHSSFGNIYFADRDGANLTLIAKIRNERPKDSIGIHDAKSVVAWVYRRGRPIVINDINDFLRMHPSSRYTDTTGQEGPAYAELAVPIIQPSFNAGRASVIGVVNVEKLQDEDTGHFTYRDIALLRSVANRLALWRAHSMVRQASASLALLTRRNASEFAQRASLEATATADPRLPPDALASSEIVGETLRSAYKLTRSQTATVRLLSTDRRLLIRFSAYPPSVMDHGADAIDIRTTDSVVAWVARHGVTCHLSNLADRQQFRAYRGLGRPLMIRDGTRSELCIPIFVSGRLVGVLNLESCFLSGYLDSIEVAAAVAEQVGLALHHARRAQEQTVLSMSTASTANVHELSKQVDELNNLANSPVMSIGGTRSTIQRIAITITDSMQSGADTKSHPPVTTRMLLREVLADLRQTEAFPTRRDAGSDTLHEGTAALALRVAFAALIDNAWNNADSQNPDCSINWRTSRFGGQAYLTMMIGNNINMDPSDYVVQELFRRPIRFEPDGRVHIGAFTAGALVRSLGGDVFIRRHQTPRFVVGVDLPLYNQPRAPKATV